MAAKNPITVARGDGIGPEIMDATLHNPKAAGARLDIEEIEIGVAYPTIEKEAWIVDIGAAKLADTPETFDVIVMPNLYGDILSGVAAQIAGPVGPAGSANIGTKYAMFEAIHGSAARRVGQKPEKSKPVSYGAAAKQTAVLKAHTVTTPQRDLVGVDVFVYSAPGDPNVVGEKMKALAGSVRQKQVVGLLGRIDAAGVSFGMIEQPYNYNGRPGHALGQGQ